MKSSSCTIKLLEKAHIGLRVRMTSDKNTVPFDNKPMKNMVIEAYDIQGFELSHPSLPRKIWVDFKQLPLTSLIIINGVIQDEITFVENIVVHQMELVKTNLLDYLELLDIKNRESQKTFVTLSQVNPGDVVSSALCENGEPLIYLGTWYTKNIISKNTYRNNITEHYLSKASPQRAFFLISSPDDNSIKEENIAILQSKYNNDDHYSSNNEKRTLCRANELTYNKILNDFRKQNKNRFKIVDYPITSKHILNLTPHNINKTEFADNDLNAKIIFQLNQTNLYYLKLKNEFFEDVSDVVANYILVKPSYRSTDVRFISESKQNIDNISRDFISKTFNNINNNILNLKDTLK